MTGIATTLLPLLVIASVSATVHADEPDRMKQLLAPDARVEKLAGGMKFTEGPVWMKEDGGYLIFSDIPSNELKRWDAKNGLSTFRKESNHANGNTRDDTGRLITCEHSARRVTRSNLFGHVYELAKEFEGRKFNSPNDAVVKSDGTIWFTDPPYGLPKGQKRELDKQFVFRLTPRRDVGVGGGGGGPLIYTVAAVADDFDMPNGLCFSPDEKRLYVADSGKPHHIRAFDVKDDNTLSGGAVVAVIDAGIPDGIRCDEQGNIWSSAGDGVHVFAPDGKRVGKVPVPEGPANLCFGGPDGKTLFITARSSLYSIRTNARGASGPKN